MFAGIGKVKLESYQHKEEDIYKNCANEKFFFCHATQF